MTIINLLPWREKARHESQAQFLATLGIAVAATLFLTFLYHIYFNSVLGYQERSNQYQQLELDHEKAALAVLTTQKKMQEKLLENIHFIFSLRKNNYAVVRLLDELAKITPESIIITEVAQEKNVVTIRGKAETNLQITIFMESIAKSPFFLKPILTDVSGKDTDTMDERDFELKFQQR